MIDEYLKRLIIDPISFAKIMDVEEVSEDEGVSSKEKGHKEATKGPFGRQV